MIFSLITSTVLFPITFLEAKMKTLFGKRRKPTLEEEYLEEELQLLELEAQEEKLETAERHAHSLASTGIDFNRAAFYITGEVSQSTYERTVVALAALNRSGAETINLILNSTGGDSSQGFAIYELIKSNPIPVDVYCVGQVMSIAATILQGGRKRYMSPMCRFMIHNGTVMYDRPIEIPKLRSQMRDMHMDSEQYIDILAERASVSKAKVKSKVSDETYLSAADTVKFGFADEVKLWNP